MEELREFPIPCAKISGKSEVFGNFEEKTVDFGGLFGKNWKVSVPF